MQHSKKYTYLHEAKQQGLPVLPMLYITDFDDQSRLTASLAEFTNNHPATLYIVRSAVVGEDGTHTAYAGYFHSSDAITSDNLESTIYDVYRENTKRSQALPHPLMVHLLVSPFIHATIGGVLFYPWLYFHQHALLAHASTPKEAVAGENTTTTLLSLTDDHNSNTPPLTEELTTRLSNIVLKLREVFNFPLDIEWAFDGVELYLLQIRPITIAPTALTMVPLSKYLPDSSYILDQYSETLGKLSPVSFSLLETLFANATQYFETLGIRGGPSFIKRIQTGTIVSDTELKKKYFASRHWYSNFLSGLQSSAIEKTLEQEATSFNVPSQFSIQTTQYAFDRLLLAEGIHQLKKRPRTTFSISQEYELSHPLNLTTYPENSLPNIWKKKFLATLIPVRAKIMQSPDLAFCTIDEFLSNTSINVTTRYNTELTESIFGISKESTSSHLELLYGAHTSAPVTYIENPALWHAPLPKHAIILTPYIPQTWIPELPHLTGIITLHVSPLSHVAITLREHHITTLRVTEEIFDTLKKIPHETLDTQSIFVPK